MSYVKHHAIIVTDWDNKRLYKLRRQVQALLQKEMDNTFACKMVSNICPSTHNGYLSFMVAPDGSTELWEGSDRGNKARDQIIQAVKNADGPQFVELVFGGDPGPNKVTRHS